MRVRVILSLLSLLFLINFSYSENNISGKVDIYLNVPSIVGLTILTPHILLIPTPEDYTKEFKAKNYISFAGKRITDWPPDPYPSWLPGTNSGWLERSRAIEMVLFTNSQRGATLYVWGVMPTKDSQKGILHLKDCFLTVDTPHTFIWKNKLEGAAARVSTPNSDIIARPVYYPPEPPWDDDIWNEEIKEELIRTYPWIGEIPSQYQKEVAESYIYTQGYYIINGYVYREPVPQPPVPLYIQLSNPNILWVFSVSRATIAPRKITFQIGVGNLDLYTEGDYTNNIIFLLMPNI